MLKIDVANQKEWSVVLSGTLGKCAAFAASELTDAIRKSTGIKLAVTPEKKTPRAVIFQLDNDSEIRFDGYRIAEYEDCVLIYARLERGLLNAVYGLLQQWGFRRGWQKAELAVIPSLASLDFHSQVKNPEIEFRGVCIFSVWPGNIPEIKEIIDFLAWNRFNLLMTSVHRSEKRLNDWKVEWENVSEELYPELEKRGWILNISEHSGRWFFPKQLFESHPEWFAMKADGSRYPDGQICYSNPEAVEYLTTHYCEYAQAHPEVQILGTWPEDGYGFCQCENCKQSGTVLNAVNHVARALEKVRPDLLVEYLSYTSQTSDVPPEILPNRNIITLIANMRVAREWKRKSDCAGAKGVYRLHYHIADNTAGRANLPLVYSQTVKDCREILENGLRGIIPFYIGTDTWWRSNLNIYILSQSCWDTELEAESMIADLASEYFPDAADAAAELFQMLEKCPHADQFVPPPWKLWQLWPTLRTDYTGGQWEKILAELQTLQDRIAELRRAVHGAAAFQVLESMERFVEFQLLTFESWHFRALAVLAFDSGNAREVKRNLLEAGRREQTLANIEKGDHADQYGVAGAWIDYEFFMNWRVQLDKQLYEMRTEENQKPFMDMNPEVELFLPALLGN